jgi:hypothetical protein
MRKPAPWLRSAGALIAGLAAFTLLAAWPQDAPKKISSPRSEPAPPFLNGPDLAIVQPTIQFSKINNEWFVEARAQVLNRGTMDFAANWGQAKALVIFRRFWDNLPDVVMLTTPIIRVAKGARIAVGGSIPVKECIESGCATPVPDGTCCREIQVIMQLAFDPAMRNDGNPNNDDAYAGNNVWPDTPQTHIKYTVFCFKILR